MKKGFTLIELLAVIVILAIIAVIATPIVLNIINDSRASANTRSIELYADAIKNAIGDYMIISSNTIPKSYNELNDYLSSNNKSIKDYYSGDVSCSTIEINTDGTIYLANCTVNGKLMEGYTYGKQDLGTLVLDHKKSNYTENILIDTTNVKYYYVYDQKSGQEVDATFDVWYDTIIDDPSVINNEVLHYGGATPINYHYTPDYEYEYKLYNKNNVGKIVFSAPLPSSNRKTGILNYIKDKYKYSSVESN